jgi:hypothetical protein
MNVLSTVSSSFRRALAGAVLLGAAACGAFADAITDWNVAFENSLPAPAQRGGPRLPMRVLAIMHVAMFDAVNGIDPKYEPYFVTASAPRGARAEAAAIQAAYTTLSALLPAHQAAYDAQLAASLAALPPDKGKSQSIALGRAWGASVANEILAWRATDGFTSVLPPFVGDTSAGFWRHVPLGAAPNAAYVYTVTEPFVVADPMAFDPGPPYGLANRADVLASAAYAADVNETKARGGAVSTVRTAAELDEALFLDACDPSSFNGVLRSRLHPHTRLVDTAREFAILNMAAFDSYLVFATIKYHYAFWRPFQAINYADEDNNPATEKDSTWTSVIPTPSHPEYPSAHLTYFTAMLRVLARLEGDCQTVEVTAAASPAYPGGTKTFDSLAAISNAAKESRINLGFHFRNSTNIGQMIGRELGDYVVDNAIPLRGHSRRSPDWGFSR